MGRQSSIKRLEPAARKFLERLMREDRHTINELKEALHEKFPDAEVSRSAIHRHRVNYEELVKSMREQDAIASMVVSELGENPDEKAGALLVQTISSLTTGVALQAAGEEKVDVETVRKLARAAKDVMSARQVARKERLAIRQEARAELLAEQEASLQEVAKAQGMDDDQVNFWRRKFLGIGAP